MGGCIENQFLTLFRRISLDFTKSIYPKKKAVLLATVVTKRYAPSPGCRGKLGLTIEHLSITPNSVVLLFSCSHLDAGVHAKGPRGREAMCSISRQEDPPFLHHPPPYALLTKPKIWRESMTDIYIQLFSIHVTN